VDRSRISHFAEAESRIPGAAGEHFASVIERGTVRVLLSLPKAPNRQQPHTQDELYVIVRGSGTLVHDGNRDLFVAGDLMFVAAGTEHWFEDFTEDLAVWVIFYGPQGGEA
jgi:mannose-6-phosphate isomerase-like protein (cupin superfamily)